MQSKLHSILGPTSTGCRGMWRINRKGKVNEWLPHLIALPSITVKDRDEIEAALSHCRDDIDLADALHLATVHSTERCWRDRSHARRAKISAA